MVKASLIFFFFFLFSFKGWSNLQFFFSSLEPFLHGMNNSLLTLCSYLSVHDFPIIFFLPIFFSLFFKKNFPFYLICCDNDTHVNISIKVELKNCGPSTWFLFNRLNLCFWDWDTIWLEKESSIMAYPTPKILNHNGSRKFNYGELP